MTPSILISTGGGSAENYLAAIQAAGGRGEARYLPAPSLRYDGLLLTGGGDIHPQLFGQENRGSRNIDRARDRVELALGRLNLSGIYEVVRSRSRMDGDGERTELSVSAR